MLLLYFFNIGHRSVNNVIVFEFSLRMMHYKFNKKICLFGLFNILCLLIVDKVYSRIIN